MLLAVRSVPTEVRQEIAKSTKKASEPIWFEEVRSGAATRMQQRVLVDSARVGVTQRNVFLRSGSVGKLRSGTAVSRLADGAEFGVGAGKVITSTSSKGTKYKRRLGNAFPRPKRGGHVVYPAAKRSIPRFASLWVQTAVRTILDAFDGKS